MRLGTPRDPALTFVLILLTCGIYYLYLVYVISQETQDFLGENEYTPGMEVLLTVLTCGIWNCYWDYRIGKRAALMCGQVGLPITDNAVLYLILDLVGLGLINAIFEQDTLNRVWKAAMTGPPPPPEPGSWPPPPESDGMPRQPRPPQL